MRTHFMLSRESEIRPATEIAFWNVICNMNLKSDCNI